MRVPFVEFALCSILLAQTEFVAASPLLPDRFFPPSAITTLPLSSATVSSHIKRDGAKSKTSRTSWLDIFKRSWKVKPTQTQSQKTRVTTTTFREGVLGRMIRTATTATKLRARGAAEEIRQAVNNLRRKEMTMGEAYESRAQLDYIESEAKRLGQKMDDYAFTKADYLKVREAIAQGRREEYNGRLTQIEKDYGGKGSTVNAAIKELKVQLALEDQKAAVAHKRALLKFEKTRRGINKQMAQLGDSAEQHNLLERSRGRGVVLSEKSLAFEIEAGVSKVKIVGGWRGVAKAGVWLTIAGLAIGVVVLDIYAVVDHLIRFTDNDITKARDAILANSVNSHTLLVDGCKEMHSEASVAEGMTQDLLTPTKWNATVTAFKSIYDRAYLQATLSQIKTISNTPVVNWGVAGDLPTFKSVDGLSDQDKTRVIQENEEKKRQWEVLEFLRPIHLQNELLQDYHNSVHENAAQLMMTSPDLPWPADSDHFIVAYSSLFFRLAILPECKPHINEGPQITAWFKDSRIEQAQRHSLLEGIARGHFAARSELDPTLPPAAPPV